MRDKLETGVREILKQLGEDPSREGLKKTPARVANALREITAGYSADIDRVLNGAFFRAPYKEMVIVRDISFHSMCEHHLLPFFGKIHIAYIPDGLLIGLSKIPRLVEVFSRRLQLQERMTTQIAAALDDKLKPKGVAIVVEAQHLCMTMRGVKNPGSRAVTCAMLGAFGRNTRMRGDFLKLINCAAASRRPLPNKIEKTRSIK